MFITTDSGRNFDLSPYTVHFIICMRKPMSRSRYMEKIALCGQIGLEWVKRTNGPC